MQCNAANQNELVENLNRLYVHSTIRIVADSNITCKERQQVVNATQGVVKNLAYPSTDTSDCSVRVKVPDHSYINIIIHDMERLSTSALCDGGLHLRTSRVCNFDETFPHKILCSFSGNMTVIQACGDVDISMTPSKAGFRFYISFIGEIIHFTQNNKTHATKI
jgi:hypothetical protein